MGCAHIKRPHVGGEDGQEDEGLASIHRKLQQALPAHRCAHFDQSGIIPWPLVRPSPQTSDRSKTPPCPDALLVGECKVPHEACEDRHTKRELPPRKRHEGHARLEAQNQRNCGGLHRERDHFDADADVDE